MKYNIISSGSNGNAVIINDILIDAGVPFSKLKNALYEVKYLILTHTHSDHMKLSTLQSIIKRFPRIKIIGNHEVHSAWHCDIIANADFPVKVDDYTFYPFECEHDVLTYGYCWEFEGQNIIYCTDTANLDNAPRRKYDWFFIESNHDEKKLELARGEARGGYSPYLAGQRHLSTQQAKAFYFMNRRSPESVLVELHKSARFY